MAINSISADTSTTIVADTFGDIWIVKINVEVTTTGDATYDPCITKITY